MTQDEIIKMWKKSGDLEFLVMPYNKIEDFARLVYAKAAEREREACAKVCDELSKKHSWEGCYANECAEEIRARGHQ